MKIYVALKVLIFCFLFIVIYGDSTSINRTYGHLSTYFNQTSWGTYRMVVGSTEISKVPSMWMQDDVNKRVRIDIGARGEPGFLGEFYFFNNSAYEVYADSDGSIKCKTVPGFNYEKEVVTYGEPNMGFLGRHILEEYKNVSADVYVGQALDAVGPLNCLVYCDSATCRKFLGMTIAGVANKYSFGEYWFGDNLTTDIPPAYLFDLPNACKNNNASKMILSFIALVIVAIMFVVQQIM